MKDKLSYSSIILFLDFACIALLLCYFLGVDFTYLYGSFLHGISRLHIIVNHLVFGFIFLLLPIAVYFNLQEKLRTSKLLLAFSAIASLTAFSTGISMELIEKYPNEIIQDHLKMASLTLISIQIAYFTSPKNKKLSLSFSVLSILILSVTAHLGASIYKGESYIWF